MEKNKASKIEEDLTKTFKDKYDQLLGELKERLGPEKMSRAKELITTSKTNSFAIKEFIKEFPNERDQIFLTITFASDLSTADFKDFLEGLSAQIKKNASDEIAVVAEEAFRGFALHADKLTAPAQNAGKECLEPNMGTQEWVGDIIRKINEGYIEINFSKEQIELAKRLLLEAKTDVTALNQFVEAFPNPEERDLLVVAFMPQVTLEEFSNCLSQIIREDDRPDEESTIFTPLWTPKEAEIAELATKLRDEGKLN